MKIQPIDEVDFVLTGDVFEGVGVGVVVVGCKVVDGAVVVGVMGDAGVVTASAGFTEKEPFKFPNTTL